MDGFITDEDINIHAVTVILDDKHIKKLIDLRNHYGCETPTETIQALINATHDAVIQ